ncbi:substrate-binding domain-containing protein [Mediterraneibacter sp. NSJ-55]|uniref:Substrate-binding domain-containing protein n=1 Tax=Mediterraneibacter hominis TaxID=2763054 RepID=A0A923LH37_9FIRM|nr:substrate-binding domain-containing protein [Mediterraneibacter hominis]MBC5688541.1 substrate-binding domain-containing protein [Mediterraneibacter hominis]
MKKRQILLATIMVTCMALCGCSGGTKEAEDKSETAQLSEKSTDSEGGLERKKIGVAFMKSDPFMVPLAQGMKDVCEENGMELIEYYADNDIETQISQCDDLLQQDIDGLIVMPVDYEGITPALEAAEKAGVPVVSVDAEAAAKEKTIAYIASDNYKAGQLCAENVLETLDGGKVVILSHPEIKCTIDRQAGFEETLAQNENFEIIAEQPCKGLMDQAMNAMDNIIQANPDIDVVFAINDGSSQGAIASLQAAGMIDDVQVYGIDGQQQQADYIMEGLLTAEAAQRPYDMGKGAAELLIKHFNGESYEYENLLDVDLITEENAADYEGF